jgi:hypothetical protein
MVKYVRLYDAYGAFCVHPSVTPAHDTMPEIFLQAPITPCLLPVCRINLFTGPRTPQLLLQCLYTKAYI